MRQQLEQQEQRAANEARAANQANELTRLQLRLTLAQETRAAGVSRILQQHQALNVLRDLTLDTARAKKKQRMEEDLADLCFQMADEQPNTLAQIADSIDNMAPYPPARLVGLVIQPSEEQ